MEVVVFWRMLRISFIQTNKLDNKPPTLGSYTGLTITQKRHQKADNKAHKEA